MNAPATTVDDQEPRITEPPARSRRALLAGTVAALTTVTLGRLAQPSPARAATGDPVVAGNANVAAGETTLTSTDINYDNAALKVVGGTGRTLAATNTAAVPDGVGGNAVVGTSSHGIGIVGDGARAGIVGSGSSGPGVWGSCAYNSPGVLGEVFGPGSSPAIFGHATNTGGGNATGAGVYGVSRGGTSDYPTPPVNVGIAGWSYDGVGALAQTTAGSVAAHAYAGPGSPPTPAPITYSVPTGTYGEASAPGATGVWGYSGASDGTGVYGESAIGVWGYGGWGVFGASDASGTGVHGSSAAAPVSAPSHTGVFGYSDSGYGVYARAATGTALYVLGKARFSRSGRTSIAAGSSTRQIKLSGVTTASYVIATPQTNRAGVFVQSVVPAAGSFTIHLNKAVSGTTYVGYLVIN